MSVGPQAVSVDCSWIVSATLLYTVEMTNNQALVKLQNGAKAIVFALQPDGKLAGWGVNTIDGATAVGTRTEQTMGTTSNVRSSSMRRTAKEYMVFANEGSAKSRN